MDNLVRIEFDYSRQGAFAYDGVSLIGECEFIIVADRLWEITHTGVREAYGGQGIAKKLVLCLVEEARKRGIKIRPTCSYAKKVLLGSEEFQDVCYAE